MTKQASIQQKTEVILLHSQENSIRAIATKTGIPKSTVARIISNQASRHTIHRPQTSGRKPLLNTDAKSVILSKVDQDPRVSAAKLVNSVSRDTNLKVSTHTIRRFLHSEKIFACKAAKKPLISTKNKGLRFRICRQWFLHENSYWNQVIWSDESKFNVFGSDGKCTVWRKNNTRLLEKNLCPSVKHSPSVMVWGCFSAKGVGKLQIIEGIMDSTRYCQILRDNLKSSARNLGMRSFIFQQDNDPKHKSRITRDYFDRNDIEVLEWPAQSPDLNPIEHLWAHIKLELKKFPATSVSDLKVKLVDIWNGISVEVCEKLVKSMPKRVEQVMRNKGGASSY